VSFAGFIDADSAAAKDHVRDCPNPAAHVVANQVSNPNLSSTCSSEHITIEWLQKKPATRSRNWCWDTACGLPIFERLDAEIKAMEHEQALMDRVAERLKRHPGHHFRICFQRKLCPSVHACWHALQIAPDTFITTSQRQRSFQTHAAARPMIRRDCIKPFLRELIHRRRQVGR
jgi:hypothetical protein